MKFNPKIDTLPLSIASRDAKTEKERKICLDLAFDIVEGGYWAQSVMDSGEAEAVLSEKAFEASRKVLSSAHNYKLLKERMVYEVSSDDSEQERCEKFSLPSTTIKSIPDVSKGKGKGRIPTVGGRNSRGLTHKRELSPKIDTFPLSIASRDAPNEQERKLCSDLRNDIVEGNPRAPQFMDSGDAESILSYNSFVALRKVLASARKYKLEKERPAEEASIDDTSHDTSGESGPKTPTKLKKVNPSSDVKKLKGKDATTSEAEGKTVVPTTRPPRPIVCGLMSQAIYEHIHKVKGKSWLTVELGYLPKYELLIDVSDEEGGWMKFPVYEDYDSGMESGPDIPTSPCSLDELDPNNDGFLIVRKLH